MSNVKPESASVNSWPSELLQPGQRREKLEKKKTWSERRKEKNGAGQTASGGGGGGGLTWSKGCKLVGTSEHLSFR